MELNELIALYRECGPVVAKLSLPQDWCYTFIDICDQEPNLLEIFDVDTERWVDLMVAHPDYKQYCDFSKFTLSNWLALIDDAPSFLDDVDLWAYPREEYEQEYRQLLLRRIAQYHHDQAGKIPMHYLNREHTLRMLKSYPELRQYCNHDWLPLIEDELKQHRLEAEAYRIAREIIHDTSTN